MSDNDVLVEYNKKYGVRRPDFSGLKNIKIAEDEIRAEIEEMNREDRYDDDIFEMLTGKSMPQDMWWQTPKECAEEYHYFDRHPEMKKYCDKEFTVMEVLETVREMEEYRCGAEDLTLYFPYINDPKQFLEMLNDIATDILFGYIDVMALDPGNPVLQTVERMRYFQAHPKMRRYILE